ncbi:MAG TPA: HD domain-containing phosphohydrolase [Pyrinomonadaceae bacterium]|jgi:response regulator RpfG family c-di-GMP phosphodiesterase|nr:HD domain-containing phosphohydrolase [Pyrinomonadaceae bacterium]
MSGHDNLKKKVLIVDDDAGVREFIADLLSAEYACTAVASAEEALACCRESEYDLVLSDIMMEGMGGLDLIPHVLELAPDTAVVMISGVQTVESAIRAMRAGAFDYVMKPFDIKHFEAAVRRALEHRSLLVAKRQYESHLETLVAQRTEELADAYAALEGVYRMTLKALTAALETRDHETHGHSERVVNFSLRLGREMDLDAEQMRSLEFGALLHDIGKIGVPDAILRKPARLTEGEWLKMREHPLHGSAILKGIDFLEGAARVVAQHHEKWDGSGYPAGLKGEEIDLNARIFAVADAFDAMTSDRVYRRGRHYEAAAEELTRCAGAQFDPRVVEAFRRVPRGEWQTMRRTRKATADGGERPAALRIRQPRAGGYMVAVPRYGNRTASAASG